MRTTTLAATLALSLPCSLARAQDQEQLRGEESDEGVAAYLLELNRKISAEIDRLAEKIDVYVANSASADVANKSRITLHNSFTFAEGGERKYSPNLGVKLHLPHLQEKLQLRFTSYGEDEVERGINESRYATPQDKSYGTSLALFQDLGKVRTEFRPRIEFTDKLQTSHLFKFTSEAKTDLFTLEPELQLFGRSDTGTGQFIALNVDFVLSPTDGVTVINEEQYTDNDNTLRTNHGLKWRHQWNELMSQQTTLIFESNNRPVYHLDRYVLRSSFGHQLYKNVLHYAVTPYVAFPKDNRFHPSTALDLKLEIIF